MMGKDAPGVGSYSQEKYSEVRMKKSPAWGLPMAPRFESFNRINQYRVSSQLGFYLGPEKYSEEFKPSFPRAQRFKEFKKYDLYNMMPGPADSDPTNTT